MPAAATSIASFVFVSNKNSCYAHATQWARDSIRMDFVVCLTSKNSINSNFRDESSTNDSDICLNGNPHIFILVRRINKSFVYKGEKRTRSLARAHSRQSVLFEIKNCWLYDREHLFNVVLNDVKITTKRCNIIVIICVVWHHFNWLFDSRFLFVLSTTFSRRNAFVSKRFERFEFFFWGKHSFSFASIPVKHLPISTKSMND